MAYNHFNNDLPVPPVGYTDWRSFYADSLRGFSEFAESTEPQFGRVLIPVGDDALQEMPYWKVAHYAAREQVEHDRQHPPLSFDQLQEMESLLRTSMRQPAEWLVKWLRDRFQEAIDRRRKR